MASVIIIGGGIIGCCSAFYLVNEGHEVTIIDSGDMLDNCSYGNAGYLSPSHFVPLASPGIIRQGLKWMMNSRSPFYVQPRLSRELVNWGWKFYKSATKEHSERSAVPLRDISLLSKNLYDEIDAMPEFDFYYEKKGMIDIFRTEAAFEHAADLMKRSTELGLETDLLNAVQVQELEPNVEMDIVGGLHFKCDAHLYPNKLMTDLLAYLTAKGVKMITGEEVTNFESRGNSITAVSTDYQVYKADQIVIASGAWSGRLVKKLKINIPMIGGRGYSLTLEDRPFQFNHPIILNEARVAITPMGENRVRFGGTMEITSLNAGPKLERVWGILESIQKYFPSLELTIPSNQKIWYGYRPCSADGLPYIGKTSKYSNLVIATGHAMLGLSLGAGTGKLVSEIISGKETSMPIEAFSPDRFN